MYLANTMEKTKKKYLSRINFDKDINKDEIVKKLINTLNNTIKISLEKKSKRYRGYIDHYVTNHGHVPLWVLVRAMTLGEISKFYRCMRPCEREEIASEFNINSRQLENFARVIVEFRNVVAHDERLFCKKLQNNRVSKKLEVFDAMRIEKNKGGYPKSGTSDFLSLLVAFKYVLSPLDFSGLWTEFIIERENLIKNIKSHFMATINDEMGLKNRWKNLCNFKPNKFFY